MKTLSSFFSLGKRDWINAFVMFVISAALSIGGDAILQALETGDYSLSSIHWKSIGAAILVAILSYLKKNFLSNSEGTFLKKEEQK